MKEGLRRSAVQTVQLETMTRVSVAGTESYCADIKERYAVEL